jgi:hypothetical protein
MRCAPIARIYMGRGREASPQRSERRGLSTSPGIYQQVLESTVGVGISTLRVVPVGMVHQVAMSTSDQEHTKLVRVDLEREAT